MNVNPANVKPISDIRMIDARTHVARTDARRQSGIAMLVVLVVIAMATVLGTAFLGAQATTTGITRNLEDQAVARQIAESGMMMLYNKIQSGDNWRSGRTQGEWVVNQTLGLGTFTAEITDDDGDPANNDDDPFVLTVTGRYRNVTHVVRSRVTPYVGQTLAGLNLEYFVSSSNLAKLADIDWDGTPSHTEIVPNVDRANENATEAYPGGPKTKWGARYSGYIEIPTSGMWTFYTDSDDGSDLSIDGNRVVDNDNAHAWRSRNGSVTLDKGRYSFETRLFEQAGWHGIVAYWQGPGVSKQVIPASAFSRAGDVEEEDSGSDQDISVAVKTTIQMWGNSRIDSYKSSKGAYSDANKSGDARVSTNGILTQLGVTMSDNATIEGKIMVRPLLPILPVITWGNSEVTKGVGYLSTAMDIEDVSKPSPGPGWATPKALSVWSSSSNPAAVTQDTRYSSISLGGDSQLTVQGEVVIVCDGDLQIDGTSQINVTAGSSLKLYVGGNVSAYSSAVLNSATEDPSRVEIFMYGNNKNAQFDSNTKITAYLYNPKGGLKMYGSSQFYGKYFGETLTMSGTPKIHADKSAKGEKEENSVAATTYVFAWDEGF